MEFLNKKRFIMIDGGALLHKAIYGKEMIRKTGNKVFPASYYYFQSIIGLLKRVGVTKEDEIIMCLDGRNSWRKLFYPIYKGQRSAVKKEDSIDWASEYAVIEKVNEQLANGTDWQFIYLSGCLNPADLINTPEGEKFVGDYEHIDFSKNYGIEADDIQAYFSKQYPDFEVVLLTCDKDLNQLCFFENTKIFSLNIKYQGQKGLWDIVKEPIKVLNDKVRLGDVSDNIIVDKINDTPLEVECRRFIIDLINLPDFIEEPIRNAISELKPKEINRGLLPFPDSLAKRFFQIYETKNIISYEKAEKYIEKRDKKRKEETSRKAKERRLKKKQEKIEMEKSLR